VPEDRGDEEIQGRVAGDGVSVVGARVGRASGPGAGQRAARARRRGAGPGLAEPLQGDPPEEASSDLGAQAPSGPATGWSLRRGGRTSAATGDGRDSMLSFRGEVVLAALAVVGVVAGIGFGLAWANLNGQNSTRQAAEQAARTFIIDVTNFKPTTIDADFAQVQNWADPGSLFAKQAAQFYNSNIRQSLVAAQAESQGQIRDLYVESLNGSDAVVYAVVDQAYQNSKMSSPATDTLRLTLDMVDTGNGWRISVVTVENPSSLSPSTPSSTP